MFAVIEPAVVATALPALAATTEPRVNDAVPPNSSWPLDPIEAVIPLAFNWLFREATTCVPLRPAAPPVTVAATVVGAPVALATLKLKAWLPPARNTPPGLFRLTLLPVR